MINLNSDNDCGAYGYFQGKCCCTRFQKFYYQRFNVIVVIIQFLIAFGLGAAFST